MFKNIEFILDSYLYHENPILKDDGVKKIKNIISTSNVGVKSVCADIFMDWPLNNLDKLERNYFANLIEKLIINSSEIGVKDIVIPFVDKSSIKSEEEMDCIVSFLDDFSIILNQKDINFSLETDLNPNDFLNFLKRFKNDKIRVNYDSGNSASNGYKLNQEVELYGHLISNIHIKDRTYKGGPVLLGSGDAELKGIKKFLENQYNGIVIFQAFRDDQPINTFKKQYEYFKNI